MCTYMITYMCYMHIHICMYIMILLIRTIVCRHPAKHSCSQVLPSHVCRHWDGWMLPGGAATVFYVPVAPTGQGVVSANVSGGEV